MRGLLALVILVVGVAAASAQRAASNARSQEARNILNAMLAEGTYDSHVSPKDNATEVKVNMYVRDMDIVDKARGELHLQLVLRQTWNDPRLAFGRSNPGVTYLLLNEVNRAWKPDLFVTNDLEATLHDFSVANTYMRIYPNGDLVFSQRVSLKLQCHMNFRKFPLDTQHCPIRLASYAHTSEYIIFEWDNDPVQMSKAIGETIRHLRVVGRNDSNCDSSTRTGTYSCIVTTFEFQRKINYYLMHVYIPCQMLVIIGFLVFFLEPMNVIVRLILTLSTLFVMVIQITAMNRDAPNVDYTKALDVWTGVCLTFVFVALVESVVVNSLARKEEQARKRAGITAGVDPEAQGLKGDGKGTLQRLERYWSSMRETSQKVDGAMRIGYPVAYVLFVVVYFLSYSL